MMRTFEHNGEQWTVEPTGGGSGLPTVPGAPLQMRYDADFRRSSDGLHLQGRLSTQDLATITASDLIAALSESRTKPGALLTCPEGHVTGPRFTLEDISSALELGVLKAYCITCDKTRELSDVEFERFLRWARGQV